MGRAIFYNNYNDAKLTAFVGGGDHLKLISEVPDGDIKTAFDRLGRCVKVNKRGVKSLPVC